MLHKVEKFIEQNKMIVKGDRIVVGVSGGADSVCLLYILNELRKKVDIQLVVAHVNHGIRGMEALFDQRYVEGLCKDMGLQLFVYQYDVTAIAKEDGLTEEEAGRNVRYQAFQKLCEEVGCNKIAIAHNRNDNAETILFHLFRGSGIKGLAGIAPKRRQFIEGGQAWIIRPLLSVTRKEIERFLSKIGLPYQIDATNLGDDYSRNKIRHHILRYVVEEVNGNAIEHIANAGLHLKEIEEYLDETVTLHYQELVRWNEEYCSISVEDLLKEHIVIRKGVLRKTLGAISGSLKDIEAKHIDDILSLMNRQVGKQIHLPYDITCIKEYHSIKMTRHPGKKEIRKMEDEVWEIDFSKEMLPRRIFLPIMKKTMEISIIRDGKNNNIPKNKCTKWFDYGKIENVIHIRTRNPGDYIQVTESGGRKKLKDYFIDQKIPKEYRSHILLVADGNHIMWILDGSSRMSEYYKVSENTQTILAMNLLHVEE